MLNVGENRLNVAAAWLLADAAAQSTALRELDLSSNELGTACGSVIARLATAQLTALDLSCNALGCGGAAGATALACELGRALALRQLSLNANMLGCEGMAALAPALAHRTLLCLDLDDNNLGVEGALALARALAAGEGCLERLLIGHNALTDAGVAAIVDALACCPALTALDFTHDEAGPAAARALAMLLPHSRLKTLSLDHNSIGPDGAAALAAALPLSVLVRLDLADNALGAEGARALALALAAGCALQVVDLSNNALGDAGMIALAAALHASNLQQLSVAGNRIARAGAEHLAAALGRSALVDLSLSCNAIDSHGVAALLAALPSSALVNLAADDYDLHHARLLPSLRWRRAQADAGVWRPERHALFPAPIRAAIATVLVLAWSPRTRACGLAALARRPVLAALFRAIATLNYFVVQRAGA